MESYGELLRKVREEQELSIEDVEAKTSITRHYIEGLENEENGAFPGEPYMIGFLKNYAEFLGLKGDDVLKLYHAKKIQESPVPVELLQKKKPKFLVPLIIILLLLVLAGTGIYLYFFVFKVPQKRIETQKMLAETKKTHQYQFSGETETHRMYVGDQILIPANEGEGNIVLTVKGTLGCLTLETPSDGDQRVELGEERPLDLDGDSVNDVILYLSDVDMVDESRGAQVRMLLSLNTEPNPADAQPDAETEQTTVVGTAKDDQTVIIDDNRPYPFTLIVTFRGECLFRYRVDSNEKIENHYTASSSSLSLNAQNGIRIWCSNINSVRLQVTAGGKTEDLGIGPDGHVQVEDIKWVYSNTDGRYRLVVEDVN